MAFSFSSSARQTRRDLVTAGRAALALARTPLRLRVIDREAMVKGADNAVHAAVGGRVFYQLHQDCGPSVEARQGTPTDTDNAQPRRRPHGPLLCSVGDSGGRERCLRRSKQAAFTPLRNATIKTRSACVSSLACYTFTAIISWAHTGFQQSRQPGAAAVFQNLPWGACNRNDSLQLAHALPLYQRICYFMPCPG
eukprot:363712-Chlamydomonas_euryale.AAC.8